MLLPALYWRSGCSSYGTYQWAALRRYIRHGLWCLSVRHAKLLVARVVTGLGPQAGAVSGITPVYTSEISTCSHQGFLGYVFIVNCK